MPVKDTGIEELIKNTTKRLLFKEGKLYATTQEIADAAGINRSALHYYFRTRDQLISQVFQDSMLALSRTLGDAMSAPKPFRKKVEDLINIYLTEMLVYPYQEIFMVTEINSAGHQLVNNIEGAPVELFLKEVSSEMKKGAIDKMNPVHFLINLFSLLSFPIMMSPLYQQFFQMSKKDFDAIIEERRAIVLRMVFTKQAG